MAKDARESKDDSGLSRSEKILREARDRFHLVEEAESENRRLALEDLEFRAGKQWPDDIAADRNRDGRPCLVVNRLPQFIQQVANDQRQNRPSIKVHPVDDRADIEVAKVIQGLIRHIEYDSGADVAYDTAFDSAVTHGRGFIRVITDYVDPMSFDQKILIKRVRDPFSVYFDPYSSEPDGSDANWAQIVEDLSPDEFRAQYPNSELSAMTDWESMGSRAPDWIKGDSCRVAEYFFKEYRDEPIVRLNTGEILLKKDLPKAPGALPEGIAVVAERTASVPYIQRVKHNGIEILDEQEWPGKYIPIIPIYGTEIYVDGKRILEGIVRNAKDSQRMYNYWVSAETEAIALAPRAPFIMAEGQDEGYEIEWKTANRRNYSSLKYKPVALNGSPLPPPQRNAFEPAVQAITQARMLAADEMKATTGIYDAALGNRSNEQSGIAIQRRNIQAQTSNFHFIDNLTRSLRQVGRILIDLIPKIYDTERTVRIIGDEGDERVVTLNAPFNDRGQEVLYALDTGTYDVTVSVGPSFASKRQEAVAAMLEITQAYPQLMQIAGDLFVKNLDIPGSQEIAERLKKTLPPGLADDKDKKPIPPETQALIQQQQQLIDAMTAQLNELNDEKQQKLIEIESRERIEMAKLDNQATIELAKLNSKENTALLEAQIREIENRLRLLSANQPFPSSDSMNPASGADGAALGGSPESIPTGGVAPGSPMEGNLQ